MGVAYEGWNFVIKKTEFSKKLDLFYLKTRFKELSLNDLSLIVMRQRQLAHDLDAGDSVSVESIIRSKIAIF